MLMASSSDASDLLDASYLGEQAVRALAGDRLRHAGQAAWSR